MTAESMLVRLAATVPAALGAWACVACAVRALRVRDAMLSAALWTGAALTTVLVVVGVPAVGILHLDLVLPADRPSLAGPSWIALAAWTAVAALLVARTLRRHAVIVDCARVVAGTAEVPTDLVLDVARAARWMGTAPPAIAAAAGGGTSFVAGVRAPVLFVPLDFWRGLDARGRRAALHHELAHVLRRDPMRLLAMSIVVDVLWPAFALRFIAARLAEAWEAQADAEAIGAGASRSALARALVAASACPPASPCVLALGRRDSDAVHRLAALRRPARAAAIALQLFLLACVLPWSPGWNGWGVAFRVDAARPAGERTVSVGLGWAVNPMTAAIGRALRHLEPRDAGRRP